MAMHRSLIFATILLTTTIQTARAQVDLSTYADANGFINVQKLTCAQLAGTWQGDADMLTTWYSGWYNGLARKHYLDLKKAKEAEHEIIVYCKANPDQLIIEAIAVVFKDMRARLGIEMKP
jgi:HdeA/HdeB family protein